MAIQALLALAQAVASVASSAKANAAKKLLEEQSNENKNLYNSEKNQDYVNSEEGQAAMRKLREVLKHRREIEDNTAAVMGGSDEARLAARDQDNQTIADTMGDISAQGTQYKAGLRTDYLNRENALNEGIANLDMTSAQSAANAASNAAGAFGSVAAANTVSGDKDANYFGGIFNKLKQNNQNLSSGTNPFPTKDLLSGYDYNSKSTSPLLADYWKNQQAKSSYLYNFPTSLAAFTNKQ